MSNAAKILVVDDDPMMRLLSSQALQAAGYAVDEAYDGYQALERITAVNPDLVLLDVTMPGYDGFAVCRTLRERTDSKHTPIIMLTSLDDGESIKNAYDAGATDFILKPINWHILVQRVNSVLRAAHAFEELRDSRGRLEHAQRIAHLGNWEWDLDSNVLYGSDEAYRIFGFLPGSAIDPARIAATLSREDQTQINQAIRLLVTKNRPFSIEHSIRRADGEMRIVEQHAEVLLRKERRVHRIIGTIRDVTVQRNTEEKIRRLAFYDSLTGLPNRAMFQERLIGSLASAADAGTQVAILFLDLDRFKRINDSLGHSVGDEFLRAIGARLRTLVRRTDLVAAALDQVEEDLVARLGGDEFTVMLTDFGTVEDIAKVAQRIIAMVKKPINIGGHEVFSSASVGIAVYPMDGADLDTLLKNADTAMFHAKAVGRDGYQYYSDDMNVSTANRLSLETGLRQALVRQEFVLHYQPKVDLATNQIVAAEALVRWNHPSGRLIYPNDFIGIAEETGMIMDLGDIVIESACLQLQAWQRAGFPLKSVAVNLSPLQFKRRDLVDHIAAILRRTGVPPQCLELEITEGAVMHSEEAAIAMMIELKDLGVSLAMDDFGVGYSSLSYLTRFPIDHLKIDRSFIADLPQNQEKAAVVRAIIAMACSLKLNTVAEGVETVDQERFLKAAGCHQFQGYLLSPPIPASALEQLIERTNKTSLSSTTVF
jgi:diguanylate cyclase (GGDEF)-like protein/PAS domain S-box-containing protein